MKIELEVDLDDAAVNNLRPHELEALQKGWKVTGLGICDKHGTGVIFVSNPSAELAADTYASLNCLSKGATDVFNQVCKNTWKKGS